MEFTSSSPWPCGGAPAGIGTAVDEEEAVGEGKSDTKFKRERDENKT